MQKFLKILHLLPLFGHIAESKEDIDATIPAHCVFSGTLTSVVVNPWFPNCTKLAGEILIDSSSNLSATQLYRIFQKVVSIRGRVVVRGTKLKELSFLKNVLTFTKDSYDSVMEISENPLLVQINFGRLIGSNGAFVIKNNPKLDLSDNCEAINGILDGNRVILGNKVDCDFQLDFLLTFTSILNVPANLTTIYGNIHFYDAAINPERLHVLKSVRKIYGCLIVEHTNFVTLEFLENLEVIVCRSQIFPAVMIVQNFYMEYLHLENLKTIYTEKPIMVNNNRILELSFREVEVLVSSEKETDQIQGVFPTENLPPEVCMFNSLKDDIAAIHENCTAILGLLYYKGHSFTESEVRKFQNIHKIYGNIEFEELDLENLSMFANLEKIYSLNVSHLAIRLSALTNLKSIEMPKLEIIYSPNDYKFSVEQSGPIAVTNETCDFFGKAIRGPLLMGSRECYDFLVWRDDPSVLIVPITNPENTTSFRFLEVAPTPKVFVYPIKLCTIKLSCKLVLGGKGLEGFFKEIMDELTCQSQGNYTAKMPQNRHP